MTYTHKTSDSLDEVLAWLGDQELVTIVTGSNSYGPFYTAIVRTDDKKDSKERTSDKKKS